MAASSAEFGCRLETHATSVTRPSTTRVMGTRRLLFDSADLRALQPEASHEPFLGEDEGVDVAPPGRGGEGLGRARVDDHDARAHADLEALALVEVGQRRVVHEEHGVPETLHAGLKAVRRGDRIVVPGRLTMLEQHAFAVLAAEEEPGLDDAREDEYALGLGR